MRNCMFNLFVLLMLSLASLSCDREPLNDPYAAGKPDETIHYTSFTEHPKSFDPAKAYQYNEFEFISQIYEPPLQYHYLKRPFVLIPLTTTALPEVSYFRADGSQLVGTTSSDQIAYSVYTVQLKPGIYYQPHPAFAKDKQGRYCYHELTASQFKAQGIETLRDFKQVGTRELTAEDYVYQIKRLAAPQVQSPIYGFMSGYIDGFKDYSRLLNQAYGLLQATTRPLYLDLREYPLKGVKVLDRYRYQITIKGNYPQFKYWLAMPFFAPMPWEADRFYAQPAMIARNISLDWEPIGTGAYMITENNPNRQIILTRNPNFHLEKYPSEGGAGDLESGMLADAGETLPFISKAVFSLEKESIPRWNKFLQGYYDRSAITSDNFDQAIRIDKNGKSQLSQQMRKRKINLQSSVEPAIFYMGFNMLDEVVGGYTESARKLRQAISIAINYEEFISIFLNGRGIIAQGPIPPEIFGYITGQAGINPYVYEWRDNQARRKSLTQAKLLLAQAGYPNGRDINTGQPLILNYDVAATGGPDEKSQFNWMRKQFTKLNIQLNIRATQYNRFQEKVRTGKAQIFSWSWFADYPDPENFLFIFTSNNGTVNYGGPNRANYVSSRYDNLYHAMKNSSDGANRLQLIEKMLGILQSDAPWIWGYYPKRIVLLQSWMRLDKPIAMHNNTLKYMRLNPIRRHIKQQEWNKPIVWPLLVLVGGIVMLGVFLYVGYRKKLNS